MDERIEFANKVPASHSVTNSTVLIGDELEVYGQRVRVFYIRKHTKLGFGNEPNFSYYTVSFDPHALANYHITKTTDAKIKK